MCAVRVSIFQKSTVFTVHCPFWLAELGAKVIISSESAKSIQVFFLLSLLNTY